MKTEDSYYKNTVCTPNYNQILNNSNSHIKESKYSLYIPATVEQKIRFICKNCWNTEWSGILFYNYEGNFEDNSLVIKCQDICVLDIGSSAYTEFIQDQRVISYMADNDLLDCQLGLVHSHQLMSTFFSNTDINTLLEEGHSRNNFVSLIVNNQGNYTAAITRKLVSNKACYQFFDQGTIESTLNKEEIQCFNLNIKIETSDYTEVLQTLNQIRQEKITPKIPNIQPISNTSIIPKTTVLDTKIESINKNIENISKAILNQIITGSILVSNNSNLDIDKWIKKAPDLYDKRFPQFVDFEIWVEFYIDYLMNDLHKEEDINACASSIIEYLTPYNTNKYITTIIDSLTNYIYDDTIN